MNGVINPQPDSRPPPLDGRMSRGIAPDRNKNYIVIDDDDDDENDNNPAQLAPPSVRWQGQSPISSPSSPPLIMSGVASPASPLLRVATPMEVPMLFDDQEYEPLGLDRYQDAWKPFELLDDGELGGIGEGKRQGNGKEVVMNPFEGLEEIDL
jgi:hypothetical protein